MRGIPALNLLELEVSRGAVARVRRRCFIEFWRGEAQGQRSVMFMDFGCVRMERSV